ncbi:MAG: TVP38/TMEM64 family protein [Pseudomonadota bacterium]|jgi:uncharacterized membrane protein YdjX (TVP38/TMEM64 family)
MRRLFAFLSNMDAQAWRTLVVSFVLFGGVGLVFVFGAPLLGLDSERTLEGWLTAARGPWSLPVAVAAFAGLAFLGTPQIVLIAAAVVAFGPLAGAAYSWVGTMVSALVGFWLGRTAGSRTLDRFSGEGVRRFMRMVGENGFLASLVVRLVPSAPFIVVNMAAGVTPMRALHFVAGTGIGIVPKIALTAFAGASILELMRGEVGRNALWIAAAAAVWLAIGWFARGWLRRRGRGPE